MNASRPVIVAALAALLLVPAAGSAGAKSKAVKCSVPKKGDLVKKTKTLVVYTVPNSEGAANLYGCLRAKGKRIRVASGFDDGIEASSLFSHVAVNARFVVWQWEDYDISCKAACPDGYNPTTFTVERIDLKTQKHITLTGQAEDGTLLVSATRGTIVWIEKATDGSFELNAGKNTLDTGAIDPKSLKLKGSTLTWTNAGASKTATLP